MAQYSVNLSHYQITIPTLTSGLKVVLENWGCSGREAVEEFRSLRGPRVDLSKTDYLGRNSFKVGAPWWRDSFHDCCSHRLTDGWMDACMDVYRCAAFFVELHLVWVSSKPPGGQYVLTAVRMWETCEFSHCSSYQIWRHLFNTTPDCPRSSFSPSFEKQI